MILALKLASGPHKYILTFKLKFNIEIHIHNSFHYVRFHSRGKDWESILHLSSERQLGEMPNIKSHNFCSLTQCKLSSLMPYTSVIKADVRKTWLTELYHLISHSLVRDSELLSVLDMIKRKGHFQLWRLKSLCCQIWSNLSFSLFTFSVTATCLNHI